MPKERKEEWKTILFKRNKGKKMIGRHNLEGARLGNFSSLLKSHDRNPLPELSSEGSGKAKALMDGPLKSLG